MYCGNLLAQNNTKIILLLLHAIFIQIVNKQETFILPAKFTAIKFKLQLKGDNEYIKHNCESVSELHGCVKRRPTHGPIMCKVLKHSVCSIFPFFKTIFFLM